MRIFPLILVIICNLPSLRAEILYLGSKDYNLSSLPATDLSMFRHEVQEDDAKQFNMVKRAVNEVVTEQKTKRKKKLNQTKTGKKPGKVALTNRLIENAQIQQQVNQEVLDVLEKQYHYPELKEKTLSLTLKKMPIRDVLAVISKTVGVTLVVDADVTGMVQEIQFEDVPLAAALHSLLGSNEPRLALIRDFEVWRVMKQQAAKEMFASKAAQERERDFLACTIHVYNAKWNDVFKQRIEKLWQGITQGTVLDKQNIYMVMDEVNKKVFCKARSAQVEEFSKCLKEMDIKIPQIRIDARVVQTEKDIEDLIGFSYTGVYNRRASAQNFSFVGLGNYTNANNAQPPQAPGNGNGSDQSTPFNQIVGWTLNLIPPPFTRPITNIFNIPFIFGNKDMNTKRLNLDLNAAENRQELKTISKPSLLVFNEESAEIMVGQQLPIDIRVDETIEGKLNNITTVNFKDIGMMIRVKPIVAPDHESVFLDVYVENSFPAIPEIPLGHTEASPEGNNAITIGYQYTIRTARSRNRVLLKSGQTTMISGLVESKLQKFKTGIPFLQDIPVLGWLFQGTEKRVTDRQLLIFITPTLVAT